MPVHHMHAITSVLAENQLLFLYYSSSRRCSNYTVPYKPFHLADLPYNILAVRILFLKMFVKELWGKVSTIFPSYCMEDIRDFKIFKSFFIF